MPSKTVLIIGIDSEIGSNLKKLLLQNGFMVEGTSRKKAIQSNEVFYFDLKKPNFELLNKKFDFVIICAAITNILQCEENRFESKKINVFNTIKLIKNAIKNSSFVIFLSSNAVFDGAKSFYKYSDVTCPKTKYGEFKNTVEEYIKNNTDENACVLRLTKVISKDTLFIQNWKEDLVKGFYISAYTNKFISPVTIEDTILAIQTLINNKKSGIFQLGGNEEMSYFDFAKSYFSSFPNSRKLIKAEVANESNIFSKFNSLETHLPKKII